MPGNLFTPVSVRRRSAAQGCANAHTDAAATVESVKSGCCGRLAVRNGGSWVINELIKW